MKMFGGLLSSVFVSASPVFPNTEEKVKEQFRAIFRG
jgi:hypothetical protein